MKVNENWELVSKNGYNYFTHKGDLFNLNICPNNMINIPKRITVEKEVKNKVYINDYDPKNEEMVKKYKDHNVCSEYSYDYNSHSSKNKYYYMETSKVKETKWETFETIPTIEWNCEKPSLFLLTEICTMAAIIYNKFSAEAQFFIMMDKKTGEYYIKVPTQKVSSASVDFNYKEIDVLKEKLVLEVHSHHTMGISFSSVDDKDERSSSYVPHIACVIKNIKQFDWTDIDNNIDVRLTFNNNFIDLKLSDVFDMNPVELKQVSKETPIASTRSYYGYGYGGYGYDGYGGYIDDYYNTNKKFKKNKKKKYYNQQLILGPDYDMDDEDFKRDEEIMDFIDHDLDLQEKILSTMSDEEKDILLKDYDDDLSSFAVDFLMDTSDFYNNMIQNKFKKFKIKK